MSWSKKGDILAVGTSKGNLMLYNDNEKKKVCPEAVLDAHICWRHTFVSVGLSVGRFVSFCLNAPR